MAAAEDDEDEYTVIYANSPLYWSMVNAGLHDVGGGDVHQAVPTSSTHADMRNSHPGACVKVSSLWKRLLTFLLTSDVIPGGHGQDIMKAFCKRMFSKLSESHLLTDDDAQFLQDLAPELLSDVSSGASISLSKTAAFVAAFLALVFVLMLTSLPTAGSLVSVTTGTMLALALPVAVVQAWKFWQTRSSQSWCERVEQDVADAETAISRSLETSAKCIRFIQESELVARGFTFVNSPAVNVILKELQSSTRQRQCPVLRQRQFCASKVLFSALRQTFAQIVNIYPVDVEVSGVVRYCCEIPLQSYPCLMQLDETNSDSLRAIYNLTDGFSVDVLKSIQQLNVIQASELIRRLAVCFVVLPDGKNVPAMDRFLSMRVALQGLAEKLLAAEKQLRSQLTAHRGNPIGALSGRKKSPWQEAARRSPLQQAYVAVHSTELHLLAALKRIQDVSNALEVTIEQETSADPSAVDSPSAVNSPSAVDSPSAVLPACQVWNHSLETVKSELNACSSCLEESIRLFQNKWAAEPSVAGPVIEKSLLTAQPEKKPITMSADDVPVVLDEVFEAYSEPEETKGGRDSQFTSTEEEVWQKRRRQDLNLCLTELQSIIEVRAAERQERESAALRRIMQSPLTPDGRVLPSDQETAKGGSWIGYKLGPVGDEEAAAGSKEAREGSQEEEEEAFDLAQELDLRMQFWKQFDQAEHGAACSLPVLPGKSPESELGAGEGEVNSDNFLLVDDRRSSSRSPESDISIIPDVVSTSTSQESGFVVVHDQQTCAKAMASSVSDSWCHMPDEISESLAHENPALQNSESYSNENESTGSESKENESTGSETKENESTGSETKEIFDSSQNETSEVCGYSSQPSASQVSPMSRSRPEGIEEHLSMPGSPSPFAFSVATMVACRARNLPQAEYTFGDSSSDEDDSVVIRN